MFLSRSKVSDAIDITAVFPISHEYKLTGSQRLSQTVDVNHARTKVANVSLRFLNSGAACGSKERILLT